MAMPIEEMKENKQIKEMLNITVAQAQTIAVIDDMTFEAAGEFLTEIQKRIRDVKAFFAPLKKEASDHHKSLVAAEEKSLSPLNAWSGTIRTDMIRYRSKQEQIQADQQRKADDAARAAAEDERLKKAAHLEKSGQKETAERLMEAPVVVPTVVLPPAAPEVKGVSFRKNWTFRVVDETKIPREFLSVDLVKLRMYAKAMTEDAKCPGVEFFTEDVMSARAAK